MGPRPIGLPGGMSPGSSIEYERIINAKVQREPLPGHSARWGMMEAIGDTSRGAVSGG